MNAPASDQTTLALVRELVVDVKDLTLKELEGAKLQARHELLEVQRRAVLGVGAAGMALLALGLLALAAALALARALDTPLWLALLAVSSIPAAVAVSFYVKIRIGSVTE